MQSRFAIRFFFLNLLFSVVKSLPNPVLAMQAGMNLPCSDTLREPKYVKTSEQKVRGPSKQLDDCKGRKCCNLSACLLNWYASTACTIGQESSYSFGVEISVGASLNIAQIVGLAVEASVSETTTTGTTNSAGIECTGPWTCSALVTPDYIKINGNKVQENISGKCGDKSEPYEVLLPVVRDNHPVVHMEPCACLNRLHWQNDGAPPPCPQECTTPI